MSPTIKPGRERKHGKLKWVADLRKFGFGRFYFDTKEKAEKEIERRKSDIDKFGQSAIANGDEIAELKRLKLRLVSTGKTITDAVEYFLTHYKPHIPCHYEKATELYIDSKCKTGKRERYYTTLENILDAFGGQLPKDCPIHEITQKQIEDWIFGRELAAWTKRGYLTSLKTFFDWCKRQRYCAESPCHGIDRVELENKAPGILTVKQCGALMEAAQKPKHKQMVPYLTLALFCGIRPEEAVKITWEEIHIKRGFVEVKVEVSKTRQRRLVELSDNAKAWLKFGRNMPVVPVGWRKRFDAVRKEAKVLEGWPHDALRHSFASYHLAMHGSQDKTATQLGHRSSQMLFQHYRELVTKEDAQKFWAILP